MTHTPERLDGISRQLGPLLSAQELQQDGDALRGGLADVEREALAERTSYDSDMIPGLESGRLRELIRPSRSRPRSSAMTASETRAGASPAMISPSVPGDQRAACHWSSIKTKQ